MSETRSKSLNSLENNPIEELYEEEYIFTLREAELLLDVVESPGEEDNPCNLHPVSLGKRKMDARFELLEEQMRGLAAQLQQVVEMQSRSHRAATEDTSEAQSAETTANEAPSQAGTTRQFSTMEVFTRDKSVPMFTGGEEGLTGGEWLARVEAEMKRRNITGEIDKTLFALGYVHTEKGPARVYAHEVGAEGVPYRRFSKMILSRFSEGRKPWNRILREAERKRGETYKEWAKTPKALRLDCMLMKHWPFDGIWLNIVMDTLYDHMVGKAVAKYRIEGTEKWDHDRLNSMDAADLIKEIGIWMEDNPLLDQQFQTKLSSGEEKPAMKTRVGAVKTESRSMKANGGKKFHCPEHGWNKTHGKEDCYKLKAAETSSTLAADKPQRREKKGNPSSMMTCFLCQKKGHRRAECPIQKDVEKLLASKNGAKPSKTDGNTE